MTTMPPPPKQAPPPRRQAPTAAPAVIGQLSAAKEPPRIILNAVEGWGKCLGKGTPVLMFDGTIQAVEDIQEGDLLMGPDSQPRRVSDLYRGHGPLFRVSPTKGESYVVNGNHILSLKMSRANGGKFHRIVNMPLCEYLKETRCFKRDALGWRVGVEWPEQSLPIPPYILGCWLGDGTASKTDITTPEPELVDEFAKYAASLGLSLKKVCDAGKAATYSVSGTGHCLPGSNVFLNHLRELNVFRNKHIPQGYKINSRAQRLELLAGLLDTDGYRNAGCHDIIAKSPTLATDCAFIARSLGLAAYVRPCEKRDQNGQGGTYYRVIISGDTDMIPNRVPRKKAAPRRQVKSVLVTGLSIEPTRSGDFFGFELDGDHLFLLGDFTVTHNTSCGAFAPEPVILMAKGETGAQTLLAAGLIPQIPGAVMETWEQLLATIDNLVLSGGYKTLVLDALSGFEHLCHDFVCRLQYKGDWGKKGFKNYQQGPDVAVNDWLLLLQRLDQLRTAQGMTILLLSHTKVGPFKNPSGDDYDRYMADCHQKTWAPTCKWADAVLLGKYVDVVAKEDDSNRKGKGTGMDSRVIYTRYRNSWDAKNRYGMPESIDLTDNPADNWNLIDAAISGTGKEVK